MTAARQLAYKPLPESVVCVECKRWRSLHPSRLCWACRQRRERDPIPPDAAGARPVRPAKTSAEEKP